MHEKISGPDTLFLYKIIISDDRGYCSYHSPTHFAKTQKLRVKYTKQYLTISRALKILHHHKKS